jgi:prepilin-type processing-associated H-X9-DG protein
VARHRIGITLIELLVVIGITSLMLAMLLPAVHSSRQAALRTECSSNMRQIILGIRSLPKDFRQLGDAEQAAAMLKERRVRICPMDKLGRDRFDASGSSYVNSRPTCDGHKPMAMSKTIVLFEVADTVSSSAVNPCEWFAARNATTSSVMLAIQAAIELQRHGGASNYAYADGHVQTIPVSGIQAWADRRYNFGLRNQGQYND